MQYSLTGRLYRQRVLTALQGGHGKEPKTPTFELVLKACSCYPGWGDPSSVGLLWYRLSLASRFLAEEGWLEDEQWAVALGTGGILPDPADVAPSVAQALVDLSHVVADRKAKLIEPIERNHRAFVWAAIGVMGELSWELGEPTRRGRDVDEAYLGTFLQLDAHKAS